MPGVRKPPSGDARRDAKRKRDRERYEALRSGARLCSHAGDGAEEGAATETTSQPPAAPFLGAGLGVLASISSLQELHGRVRMTGEGSAVILSAIDAVKVATQTDEYASRSTLYGMLQVYGINPEAVENDVVHFAEMIPPQFQDKISPEGLPIGWHQFPGQRQRPTPATSPKGLLEIIALLPGRAPAAIRKAAFETLARVLGGDATIMNDVLRMRRVQEALGETDPGNPLRTFGQTATETRSFSDAVLGVAVLFGSAPETLALQPETWCKKQLENHATRQSKIQEARDAAESKKIYAECKQMDAVAQRAVSDINIARAEATEARAKARKANAEARMAEAAAGGKTLPSAESRATRRQKRTPGIPIRDEEALLALRRAPVPVHLSGDSDLEGYRAAGMSDDALPASADEAERWRKLAATQKQHAIRFRHGGRVIHLVPRGDMGHDGAPACPEQWEPLQRAVASGV